MAVTPDASLGQFIATALKTIGLDALKVALPIINDELAAIAANPTPANLIAQKAVLLVRLQAALPALEQAVITDLVAQVQADLQALGVPFSAALAKAA